MYVFRGKQYRSYKHPILEYIFQTKTNGLAELPDEIVFTYEDIRLAMAALGIERDAQASISNFTIDLTRRAASHESRVPESIWESGYDLDRASSREARRGIAGRLVRKELKPQEPWIVWPEISADDTVAIPNQVPREVQLFLGNDEGALLSVIDYCDILSLVLHGQRGTIKRVQHPKKWQPGEVDGLYFSTFEGKDTLYPVEAKALSTGDNVNLAQIQGMYKTIKGKIDNADIIPLAIQMIPEGMYIAVLENINEHSDMLIITRYLKVELNPPIEKWQKRSGRLKRR